MDKIDARVNPETLDDKGDAANAGRFGRPVGARPRPAPAAAPQLAAQDPQQALAAGAPATPPGRGWTEERVSSRDFCCLHFWPDYPFVAYLLDSPT